MIHCLAVELALIDSQTLRLALVCVILLLVTAIGVLIVRAREPHRGDDHHQSH